MNTCAVSGAKNDATYQLQGENKCFPSQCTEIATAGTKNTSVRPKYATPAADDLRAALQCYVSVALGAAACCELASLRHCKDYTSAFAFNHPPVAAMLIPSQRLLSLLLYCFPAAALQV